MRIVVVATTVLLAAVGLASAGDAAAAIRRATAIPAQSLDSALRALAQEREFHIVYLPQVVNSLRTQGASGELTRDEALTQLLIGTGLVFRYIDEDTVTIVPAAESHDKAQSSLQKTELEEIIVTGSRIQRVVKQDAQPVQFYTSEQIERSGQSTLVDFLNSLPQASMQSASGNIQIFNGQRGVRLHGLPLGSTLVLLDGHPIQTSRYGLFDLSVVPMAAVERIEVIPVGSSAVYGSDALAGVVNLILKKNFEGFEISGKYGIADDIEDGTASFAFGGVYGRASFSLVGSFQKQTELTFGEREISARGNYTGLGGADLTVDQCSPGNIYSLNGQNLPGLNATRAAIPTGVEGRPAVADFQATAGQIRRCRSNLNFAAIPAMEQAGGLTSIRYELTPATEIFFETLYSHFKTAAATTNLINLTNGSTGSFVVSAANPFNPFGVNVGVSYTYDGMPRSNERTQMFVRPMLGVRGSLWGDWRWEVNGLYSYDDFRILNQGVNLTAIRQALASSNSATALNVFASGAPGSQELLSSFISDSYNRYYNSLASAQAIVRGPMFDLPAGPLQIVVGGEYGRVRQWDQLVGAAVADRHRETHAAFTEARVPILASDSGAQAGEKLALSLALRYDESNDFGGETTGQTGIEWRPFEELLVRGTYGTSYRAPELSELFGVTSVFSASLTDPFRGNRTYTITDYRPGPNPDLNAETGHSHSFGLVYMSPRLADMETSLTYWSVAYRDYIAAPNINDVVAHPEAYPSAVIVRGPPSAQDIANGQLGPITSLRVGVSNFGAIDVSGVDVTTAWRHATRFGSFKPSLSAAYTFEYDAALTPGLPQQNYVSQAATSPGFAPRWKGSAGLAWDYGAVSASFTGRYVGPYNDYTNFVGVQPHELGDFWLCDATLRYALPARALGASALKNASITLGGVNIFNNLPQFSYHGTTAYDFSQSDIRGRFLYAQIGVRF